VNAPVPTGQLLADRGVLHAMRKRIGHQSAELLLDLTDLAEDTADGRMSNSDPTTQTLQESISPLGELCQLASRLCPWNERVFVSKPTSPRKVPSEGSTASHKIGCIPKWFS
jgi:hypothetical protein